MTVGINQYHNLQPLSFAQQDAEAMRDFFVQEIAFEQVYHFTNTSAPIQPDPGAPMVSQPTYGTLRRFLRVRFEQPFLQAGDNFWFFFAGHGVRHGDRDYLMPLDGDPGDVENTAIAISYVSERLRRCGADNVILLVDACRSQGKRAGVGVGSEAQQGVISLFACSPKQSSYEIEEIGQGSFTRALLQGLRLQGEGNCATVERLCHYLSYEIPDLNRRYHKPVQTPYAVVEPACKYHLILLPQRATLQDVNQLKKDALQAEVERKAALAKQYWIRVLAVSPADWEAIQGIERLARQPAVPSAPEQTVSAQKVSAPAPATAGQPEKSASPVSQRRRRRLENKWDRDKELLDSLEQNQNALYEQRNYTSNAAERNNLDRQIEALEKEIEAALARYEATERELAALQRNDAPLPTARAEQPTQRKQERPIIVASATPATTPALPTFDFEVVTLNARGEEKERQRGQADYFSEELGNGVTLEMVSIPGGSFMMGSPEGEGYKSEKPQHRVAVPAFFMGKYAVTQAQWKVVAALPQIERELEPDPSRFKGSERPVETVSWLETVEFCQRLSRKSGREYRLPSEAEWEYACRAGTTTPFHFGETITTDLANYRGTDWEYEGKTYPGFYGSGPRGEFREETTPVGHFKIANPFGLYDMHGNVWEWCADQWHDTYEGAPIDGSAWIENENDNHSQRLVRGGSWLHLPWVCRSAYRDDCSPGLRDDFLGLRVVCSAPRT